MVYTAVPPDYCDHDVQMILQHTPSGVNSLEKGRSPILPSGTQLTSTFKALGY
jgi:hypothetical protein